MWFPYINVVVATYYFVRLPIPPPDYICSGFERIDASLSLLLYIFRYLVTAGTTTSTSIIIRAGFEPGTVQDGLNNHLTGLGNRPSLRPPDYLNIRRSICSSKYLSHFSFTILHTSTADVVHIIC